jgi:hypothetical protein
MRDHQRALAVLEQLLEHDDFADRLVAAGDHDIQRLVEHDLLAGPQVVQLDAGADADSHLPPAGEHIGRAVLGRLEEDPEPGRRLGQPVHFFLERKDLITRFAQSGGEPLILPGDAREACLGFAQPLLQQAHLPGRIGEPASQGRDFLLEEGNLRGQDLDLVVIPAGTSTVVTRGHAPHPLPRADLPRPYLPKVVS